MDAGSDSTIIVVVVVLAAIAVVLAALVGAVWFFKSKRGADATNNEGKGAEMMSAQAQSSATDEPIYGNSSFSNID